MFYNAYHKNLRGKGTFVSESERMEFREFLQFCIERLKAGMTEEEIFAAWKVANDIKMREAG